MQGPRRSLPPAAPVDRSGGQPAYKPPEAPSQPAAPGAARSGSHPTYQALGAPDTPRSGDHPAYKPPTAPPPPTPGRSGGHPAYRPPEAAPPPAPPGRSGGHPVYKAPPAPPPEPVAPAPPRPAPTACVCCGASLTADADRGLCPACQTESRALRQSVEGYTLVRELGRGSMGLVYLAVRHEDLRATALKTIIPAAGGSEAQVTRFLREAGILRELQHPNIVAFRDMGESGGLLYFAMDFVRGQDAYRLLKKQGPFEVRRAAGLIGQLLDALAFAHGKGFVHRDIKPSNLLIEEADGAERLMVADFGLAKVYQASNLSGLTMTGDVGGTIPFMAPEQITEYRMARPPVDQYSAAATLYNLLTAAYVYNFPGSFQNQLLTILNESPVPIRKRRPEIPEGLANVIHRGLAREPGARFPHAAAMRDALRKFA